MQHKTRDTLNVFIEKANELLSESFTRFLADQGTGWTLNIVQGQPLKVEQGLPERESRKSYLMTFRLFIQQNDRLSVVGQQPSMQLLLRDPGLSRNFRDTVSQTIREMNDFLLQTDPDTPEVDSHVPNRKEVMETFLYGDLSHAKYADDSKERATYEEWRRIQPVFAMLENQFYGTVYQLLFGIKIIKFRCEEELDPSLLGTLALSTRSGIPQRRKTR